MSLPKVIVSVYQMSNESIGVIDIIEMIPDELIRPGTRGAIGECFPLFTYTKEKKEVDLR